MMIFNKKDLLLPGFTHTKQNSKKKEIIKVYKALTLSSLS